jgi:tetratricopeptide (TPR) repeat protein
MKPLVVFLFLSFSFAQNLNEEAQMAIANGQAAMQQAITTYAKAYPDLPLWQQAINYGKEAVKAAPNQAEPLRFLAEVYSRANWYGPSYKTWNELISIGYTLDADAIPLFEKVTFELGYGAYAQKNYQQALEYFQKIIEVVPYDKEAYVWAGRILLETKRPEEAIAYWQIAVQRDNTDERAQYFLNLSQDQAKWGIEATNAFRQGYSFYEEGDFIQASNHFNLAVSKNEMYSEAWAWLGRVAFEQGTFGDAATYYREATRLEPSNETYKYFFEQAELRMNQ